MARAHLILTCPMAVAFVLAEIEAKILSTLKGKFKIVDVKKTVNSVDVTLDGTLEDLEYEKKRFAGQSRGIFKGAASRGFVSALKQLNKVGFSLTFMPEEEKEGGELAKPRPELKA